MRKIKEFFSCFISEFISEIIFIIIMSLCIMLTVVLNKYSQPKVEVITVDCGVNEDGETMLFDEVEEFMKGKKVISVDYEVYRGSEDQILRTAVITYKPTSLKEIREN